MMKKNLVFFVTCLVSLQMSFSQTSLIAVSWSGDNAGTTTFPFDATYKASIITSASHNYSGLTPNNNNDYSWNNPNSSLTIDPLTAPYLSFTVNTSLTHIKFNRFVINALANSGTTKEQLRWSIDNYASSLGEFTSSGTNHTLTSVNLSGIDAVPGGEISFRIYFYNSTGDVSLKNQGGNTAVDDTPFFDGLSVASVKIYYLDYTPLIPAANAASDITSNSFKANWNSSILATGYTIQVSTNSHFTSHVSGYNNLDVGNETVCLITGLTPGTTYYYRVRAYNEFGTSGRSSIITVATPKLDQTITFENIPASTYGDTDFNPGAMASSGLSITYSSDNIAIADIVNNAVCINAPGTVTIHADQEGNSSYHPATRVSQTLIVIRKTLTITGAVTENKEYDGNANATITGATLAGVVGSDEVILNNSTSGTFTSLIAGTDISIITTMTISGADTGNYMLAQPALSADITQRTLEITANEGQYKNSGEPDPVFLYQITNGNLLPDDSISGSLSRSVGETGGLYSLHVGTLSAGNNYSIAFISADFEIKHTTDLLQLFHPDFMIFPNPAVNSISIQTEMYCKKITLTNLQGKIIMDVERIFTGTFELDIQNIPAGDYILNIITIDNKKWSTLIIKNP